MQVRIKYSETYNLPKITRATDGSVGYDLFANVERSTVIFPGGRKLLPTGIFLELPPTIEAQVRSRSGNAINLGLFVLNSPGTIDHDYRGEIQVILANFGAEPIIIKKGDKIAQLVFSAIPYITLIEVNSLSKTPRNTKGFGSTDSQTEMVTCPRCLGTRRRKVSGEFLPCNICFETGEITKDYFTTLMLECDE